MQVRNQACHLKQSMCMHDVSFTYLVIMSWTSLHYVLVLLYASFTDPPDTDGLLLSAPC